MIVIREADAGDVPALSDLYRQLVSPVAPDVVVDVTPDRIEEIRADPHNFLFVLAADEALGWRLRFEVGLRRLRCSSFAASHAINRFGTVAATQGVRPHEPSSNEDEHSLSDVACRLSPGGSLALRSREHEHE